jgi:hypothetical protein
MTSSSSPTAPSSHLLGNPRWHCRFKWAIDPRLKLTARVESAAPTRAGFARDAIAGRWAYANQGRPSGEVVR